MKRMEIFLRARTAWYSWKLYANLCHFTYQFNHQTQEFGVVMKIILRYQVGKLGTVLYSVANFISYITYCEIFSEHEFYDLSLLLYKHMIKCIWKIFNEVIQKEKRV